MEIKLADEEIEWEKGVDIDKEEEAAVNVKPKLIKVQSPSYSKLKTAPKTDIGEKSYISPIISFPIF